MLLSNNETKINKNNNFSTELLEDKLVFLTRTCENLLFLIFTICIFMKAFELTSFLQEQL